MSRFLWKAEVQRKAQLCGWNGTYIRGEDEVCIYRGSITDLRVPIDKRVRVQRMSDGMFEVTYPGFDENTRVVPEHKLLETVRGAILEGYVPDPVPVPVPVVGALRTFVVTPAGGSRVPIAIDAFDAITAAITYANEGQGQGCYNVRDPNTAYTTHIEVVEGFVTSGAPNWGYFGRSLGRMFDPTGPKHPVKVAA